MSNNRDHPLFSKILVALDGSESSSKAAKRAIDLAEKHGGQILLRSILLQKKVDRKSLMK